MIIRKLIKNNKLLYSVCLFIYHKMIIIGIKVKIKKAKKLQQRSLYKIKNKEVIRCLFFVLYESIWKYDEIYKRMVKHPRFDPVIVVCPIVKYGKDRMISTLENCFDYFKKQNYNVILSYNKQTNNYIDIRELNPDIIFYTSPYRGLIDDRYYIDKFMDVLTVYVPYFICSNKAYQMSFNEEMHNLVWRKYCETDYHKSMSIEYASNNGINVVTTGYPGIDGLLSPKSSNHKDNRKIIIWAPHHTIEPAYSIIYYSCFLKYCDFMLEMVDKYCDSVDFVFKPHPLLREKLYIKWGKKKTDEYYNKWSTKCNSSLNEGDYIDLFNNSSAMIHDSASFIAEYLYTNKPVMRTLNGEDIELMYNEFGLKCISNHYLSYNEKDIEQFIQNVINDIDPLKEQRTKFVNEVLMPKGSPSQNIIDDILESIDNQILYRN